MDKVFNVTVPKEDYKASLFLLLLWINRFIIKDKDRKNSKLYGGTSDDKNYVFWFVNKSEADRAEIVLKDVKDRGYPKSCHVY
jgi:hypothetical protein